MKKIKALIVDDEELARKNIEYMVGDCCPDVEIVGMAGTIKEARVLIESHDPDLVFLDIEMPNGSGFDLLDSLEEINFSILFITAYHEHALRAFKYSALDYLLKPIDAEELERAVARIRPGADPNLKDKLGVLMEQMQGKGVLSQKIALPTMEGLLFINLDDILYCESMDNYTQFYLTGGKRIMVSKTIKHFENLLDPKCFHRVHRSNIINLKYIEKYVKGEGGYIVMSEGSRIPVSRRRKESFLQLFQEG